MSGGKSRSGLVVGCEYTSWLGERPVCVEHEQTKPDKILAHVK